MRDVPTVNLRTDDNLVIVIFKCPRFSKPSIRPTKLGQIAMPCMLPRVFRLFYIIHVAFYEAQRAARTRRPLTAHVLKPHPSTAGNACDTWPMVYTWSWRDPFIMTWTNVGCDNLPFWVHTRQLSHLPWKLGWRRCLVAVWTHLEGAWKVWYQ